ncbi:MAG TPA: NlpC/P60 family protein [Chitinophagaceae bacterium]|nr:NlpC/P60 family protein [Chitinophagaceae bacterium]
MRGCEKLVIAIISSALLIGCSTLKTTTKGVSGTAVSRKSVSNSNTTVNLQFIEGIETEKEEKKTSEKSSYVRPAKLASTTTATNLSAPSLDIESISTLQFKYASRLGIEVEAVTNTRLFELIDEWWGTKYKLGGSTKSGVDCSSFVQTIMAGVFLLSLPRTAREQYEASVKIADEELKESDLVFFNTLGGISHVGIYLTNNKFVHASTSGGVMISDLNDSYWKARYKGAGRVR